MKKADLLFELNQTALSESSTEAVIDKVMELTERLFPAEQAFLYLFDPEEGILRPAGLKGRSCNLEHLVLYPGEGVAGRAFQTQKTLLVGDVAAETDWIDRRIAEALGVRSIRAAPLRTHAGPIGVLNLFSPRRITGGLQGRRAISALEAFTDCAAMAIAYARLTGEVEKKESTLRQAQSQLIQAEKLAVVSEVLSGLAHELNNPLTSVIGFSELLLGLTLPENARKYAERIHRQGRRGAEIIRSLLHFARKPPPYWEPTDLNALIVRTLALKQYSLKIDGIQTLLEMDPNLPMTLADANQIQQVLFNLLGNAHQALQGHAVARQIRVRTETLGAMVRVSIEDNGPGIPKIARQRIFDPFFTTKDPGKGTGMGLPVAFSMIQRHGGKLFFESTESAGSRFWFDLPIRTTFCAGPKNPVSQGFVPVAGRRVLVVDDEEIVSEVCRISLEQIGLEVDSASGTETALHCVRETGYDLLLMDLRMPGCDGLELLKRMRLIRPESCRNVILMTGDLINPATSAFVQTAGAAVLEKPFDAQTLQRMVVSLLTSA